jgi:hypothetical protein
MSSDASVYKNIPPDLNTPRVRFPVDCCRLVASNPHAAIVEIQLDELSRQSKVRLFVDNITVRPFHLKRVVVIHRQEHRWID